MDIQEYLTYRIGIWEKVKSEAAMIIANELELVNYRLQAEKKERRK